MNRQAVCLKNNLLLVCSPAPLLVGLFLWLAPWLANVYAQTQSLTIDTPQQRELAGGETQAYEVALTTGQFLYALVEQQGIDLVLKLSGPDGQSLIEMDSPNSTQGPEVAALIATQAGNYRIEISSRVAGALPGQYVAKLAALRAATESDSKWISAQSVYLEADVLRRQATAAARQQAIEKYQAARLAWAALGEQVMEAHTLIRIGEVWRALGQAQKAFGYFTQALELQRSGPAQREDAYTRLILGVTQLELGDPRRALDFFAQALLQQRAMKDAYAEAGTLLNQGQAYAQLGEARRALEYYGPALVLWQKVRQRTREATTLHYLGLVYETLGEAQKALEYYLRALALHRDLRNRDGEAQELNSLGFVNGQLGEWSQALQYYNQSLALSRVLGNQTYEALALSNIGAASAAQQEHAKALEHYSQALKLYQSVRNPRSEAGTLEKLGNLYAAQAQPMKALEAYDQALPLRRAAGDRWGEASTLDCLGNIYLTLNVPQKALDNFNQALPLYRTVGDRRGEVSARYGLARVARAQGNLAAARQHVEAALTLAEAVRADAGSQQARASYFGTVQQYYQLHLDVLMQLHRAQPAVGFDALALQTSERARARSLLEELAEARADIRQGVDPALLARERELQQLLNAKAQRQLQAPLKELQQDLSTLEDEYRQLQVKLRQSSPRYAALTQPQPLGLAELQAQLDADTLLLEYALGAERSYVWAVTKTELTSYELPPQAQITPAAQAVSRLLTARGVRVTGETPAQQRTRLAQSDAQLKDAAQTLSELILAPVAAQLKQRPLLIVADGALQYVPFAMLPEPLGEGETGRRGDGGSVAVQSAIRHPPSAIPLIVNHEVVTLPSASTLAELRKELVNRPPAPKLLALLADPVFNRADALSRAASLPAAANPRPGNPRPANPRAAARNLQHEEEQPALALGRLRVTRLPYTRQEAERIYALAPAGTANLKLLDFQANRAAALNEELGQYRYLHFATHGLLDSERQGMSALVFSLVDEKGQPQEGLLRANEIYNLNLPADLVVLSACQTGLGKDVKGEGLIGLTRGFMYAGAARVVVSLWNVNDRATAELMVKFYERMLKDGQRPAAALRAAQVEMWRQSAWQSPYYWAGFVLQGEWK